MNKRLEYLEKVTSEGAKDAFAWYGLAMEYKNLKRVEEALATFEKLKAMNKEYVPMYLMCGTMLLDAGRGDEGKAWLRDGIAAANAKGDGHALGELTQALDAA